VLEALSHVGGPHRLADLATGAAVGKPSAHRILAELVKTGFATSPATGYYARGPRLLALASMVLGEEARTRSVASVLEGLRAATGHTVHFAVLSGTEAVYVHKVNANQPYQMASRVGMRIPLYCTAVGKCMLAWLEPPTLEDIWARVKPVARTPKTLTTRRRLERELATIRAQGFSIDDEENELNVRCVGAPVFDQHDRVLGGVSVSALAFQMSCSEAAAVAPELIEAARLLGVVLSGSVSQAT
jgi:IclR family acetate operon transcriptional repressor